MRSLLIAIVSLGTLTFAQVSYEGQPVSSIELIANPHLDPESFRSLILQRPGQPYSEKDVQASIAALKQKGGFTNVELNVTPEATGLHLTFVLEPAYYVGILEFPGAGKAFSYTRLLQVVNISDEQAFAKARLPGAEAALHHFFETNGYYQATVNTDLQLDDNHQIASVTFNVVLGKRARIGQVGVQGVSPEETATLLHSLRSIHARLTGGLLKTGKPYTPERMKSANCISQKCIGKAA